MATPSELRFGATVQSEQHPDPRTFLRWLAKKGISQNKCELHDFPRTGRGVMASANMKAGDVVVEVCFLSTVNPEGAAASCLQSSWCASQPLHQVRSTAQNREA
jgi:hypothetical protein